MNDFLRFSFVFFLAASAVGGTMRRRAPQRRDRTLRRRAVRVSRTQRRFPLPLVACRRSSLFAVLSQYRNDTSARASAARGGVSRADGVFTSSSLGAQRRRRKSPSTRWWRRLASSSICRANCRRCRATVSRPTWVFVFFFSFSEPARAALHALLRELAVHETHELARVGAFDALY